MKQAALLATLILTCATSLANESTEEKPTTIELIFFQHDVNDQVNSAPQPLSLMHKNPSTVYSYHSIEGIYLANTVTDIMEKTQVSGPILAARMYHDLLKNYEGLLAPYNNWQHINQYPLQAKNQKNLVAIKDKLSASYNNQVLFHIAWILPNNSAPSSVPFIFNSNTLSNDDIEIRLQHAIQGKITVTGNKNFDINAAISVVEHSKPYQFNFSRRMKKNQLNYIDNEKYGLFAYISS